MGSEALPEGVILLPVKGRAENIFLTPGARLSGIRFRPAIGYGVLKQHYDKPTLLSPEDDLLYGFYKHYFELRMKKDSKSRVKALQRWANRYLDFNNMIPSPLEEAMQCIEEEVTPGKLSERIDLSQRQIERIFKRWVGMGPKHYQRILRVKKAICYLKLNKNDNLVDAAQRFGFSDQAHMTREFRDIACITPGQL